MNSLRNLFGNIHFTLKLVEFMLCLAGVLTMYAEDTLLLPAKYRDPIVVAQTSMLYIIFALLVCYLVADTHKLFEVFIVIVGVVHNICGLIFAFLYYAQDGHCKEKALYVGVFLTTSAGVLMCDALTYLRRKQVQGVL